MKTKILVDFQICISVPLMFMKFLSLPNHSIRVCLKGKRINRGVGYGLEIPAEHMVYGNQKAIQWAKRTLDGVILKKNQLFPTCVLFFLDCLLLGSNFHWDNTNST